MAEVESITGKQYDYGGVALRNKTEKKVDPNTCVNPPVRKKIPPYMLQPDELKGGLDGVYERLAAQSDATMMYIVDPYVEVDFDFDYYPTQYDADVVHVWAHTGAKNTAVRFFVYHNLQYESEKQILNNQFDRLKEMPTAISKDKLWDRFYFNSRRPLLEQLKEHARTTTHEWFWTVDSDVTHVELPTIMQSNQIIYNKVHAWQRANPVTGAVHSYGGVRLWPQTVPDITSDDIKLNSTTWTNTIC